MAKKKISEFSYAIREEDSPVALDRPFKTIVITLGSEAYLGIFQAFLVNDHRWHETVPCPNGVWEIVVKNENRQRIEHICKFVFGNK